MSIKQYNFNGSTDYISLRPESISITLTHPTILYKPKIDEADLSPKSKLIPSITVGQTVDKFKDIPLSTEYQINIDLYPDEILIILTDGKTTMLVQPITRNTPCPTLL